MTWPMYEDSDPENGVETPPIPVDGENVRCRIGNLIVQKGRPRRIARSRRRRSLKQSEI